MTETPHPDHRTEVAIQHAEAWCNAQPTVDGFAVDESVGIIRHLISLLMKHAPAEHPLDALWDGTPSTARAIANAKARERLTATPTGAGPGEVDNSPKRLAYEVKMMLSSVASHGPAALTTTHDPMYTARLLGRLRDTLERLIAARDECERQFQEKVREIGLLTAPPTDDEREALDYAIRVPLSELRVEYKPFWKMVRAVQDSVVASGFRRQGPITDAFREIRVRMNQEDVPMHVAADVEQIICETGNDFGEES